IPPTLSTVRHSSRYHGTQCHVQAPLTLRSQQGPATPENDTLALHDALPISLKGKKGRGVSPEKAIVANGPRANSWSHARAAGPGDRKEHTSELQSRSELVCRLLLEKKKNSKDKNSYDVLCFKKKKSVISKQH